MTEEQGQEQEQAAIEAPIELVECPRDAMQGMHDWIPTDDKVAYMNQLLKVGFDILDFGSFVSPKAIPQMRDTEEVLARLQLEDSETELSAIVVNMRGADVASVHDEISYLGFPFSISNEFQLRNTKQTQEEALEVVEEMLNLCETVGKRLIVYASMAFGNPYEEMYDVALMEHWIDRLVSSGVEIISLADTVGVATPKTISKAFNAMGEAFPRTVFSAHFHTTPDTWEEKVLAAYNAGCRRFEGALKGFGGCPMAKDDLVGNMPTEKMISFFERKKETLRVDQEELQQSLRLAAKVLG